MGSIDVESVVTQVRDELVIAEATESAAKWGPVRWDVEQIAEAELAELLPGRYVAFRVTDTGTGMDVGTAERAFEPFFTTKGGDAAAGLGLSVVRRFATQAGGNAWLRSELGEGTTITVVLPAAAGSDSPAISQGRAAFAAQAKAMRPGLPILFMSGYEPQDIATAAGGIDPFEQIITKPFSRPALLAKVTQMLTADAGVGKAPGR